MTDQDLLCTVFFQCPMLIFIKTQTISCHAEVPDTIFHETVNSLYVTSRSVDMSDTFDNFNGLYSNEIVFLKMEPVMLNYKSSILCDHTFSLLAHRIPPQPKPAALHSNDTSHSPEHTLVQCIYSDLSLTEAEGLKCVPLKPSGNKYNVLPDCERLFVV